jgi:LPS sulfotransferase NodH
LAAYVIAAEARSGSNLLAEALIRTDKAGEPDEWFSESFLHRRLSDYGLAHTSSTEAEPVGVDGRRYVEQLVSHTASAAWFGVKMHYHQYLAARVAGLGDVLEHITALVGPPLIIRLTREDRVRQAVSTYIAAHTGVYYDRAGDGAGIRTQLPHRYWRADGTPGPNPSDAPPPFDFDEIAAIIAAGERDEAAWDRLTSKRGLRSLRLTYEDLIGDRHRTLSTVFDALGIDVPPLDSPTFRRQAGTINDELVALYVREKRLRDGI